MVVLVRLLVLATVHLRVLARVARGVLRSVLRRILRGIARRVPNCVRAHTAPIKAEAGIGVAILVVVAFLMLVLPAIDLLTQLRGAAQLDVALERLQLHPRAPRADLERLAVLAGPLCHRMR